MIKERIYLTIMAHFITELFEFLLNFVRKKNHTFQTILR